jgi:hypothetical protein
MVYLSQREIEMLEEIESLKAQLDSKESRIKKLKDGLMILIDKCEECDGWESFPSSYIEDAYSVCKENNHE